MCASLSATACGENAQRYRGHSSAYPDGRGVCFKCRVTRRSGLGDSRRDRATQCSFHVGGLNKYGRRRKADSGSRARAAYLAQRLAIMTSAHAWLAPTWSALFLVGKWLPIWEFYTGLNMAGHRNLLQTGLRRCYRFPDANRASLFWLPTLHIRQTVAPLFEFFHLRLRSSITSRNDHAGDSDACVWP